MKLKSIAARRARTLSWTSWATALAMWVLGYFVFHDGYPARGWDLIRVLFVSAMFLFCGAYAFVLGCITYRQIRRLEERFLSFEQSQQELRDLMKRATANPHIGKGNVS